MTTPYPTPPHIALLATKAADEILQMQDGSLVRPSQRTVAAIITRALLEVAGEDTKRLDWLGDNYGFAQFDYQKPMLRWDDRMFPTNIRAAIDAAMTPASLPAIAAAAEEAKRLAENHRCRSVADVFEKLTDKIEKAEALHASAVAELEKTHKANGDITTLHSASTWREQIALRERDEARAELKIQDDANEILTRELTATKAALAEERELIRKLTTDSTYEGGTQYWIAKHDEVMLALATKQQECEEWKEMAERLDRKCIDEQRDHVKTCGYHDATKAQLTTSQLAHEKTKAELVVSKAREEQRWREATDAYSEREKNFQRAESAEQQRDKARGAAAEISLQFQAEKQLADRLAEALNKIDGLQKRWPGWSSQDLYEESQEIAGPAIEAHEASRAPRAGMAATGKDTPSQCGLDYKNRNP